jgi:hypothetical protein
MKSFVFALIMAGFFVACEDSSTNSTSEPLEAVTVSDLDASGSNYVFYDLKNGAVLTLADSNSTKWDIAFKGSAIIVNSAISGPGTAQAQLVDGLFDEYTEAPATGYLSDSEAGRAIVGSGGWYTYTGNATSGAQHAILPNAGKIIIVKNTDGTYSKIQIISYYKGNPNTSSESFINSETRPASRHYTFRFITQPDGSRIF